MQKGATSFPLTLVYVFPVHTVFVTNNTLVPLTVAILTEPWLVWGGWFGQTGTRHMKWTVARTLTQQQVGFFIQCALGLLALDADPRKVIIHCVAAAVSVSFVCVVASVVLFFTIVAVAVGFGFAVPVAVVGAVFGLFLAVRDRSGSRW